MLQNRKTISCKLTDLLADTRAEYKRLQERDRMEQARAGATTIRKPFAFKEIKEEADGIVHAAGGKALSVIDAELERAGGALVESPTTEAANYVATIAARDNLTVDEVRAALSKYRDHSSQKAIKAAAKRSGIMDFGNTTEAEVYIDDLRHLREDVDKTFTTFSFADMSDGKASIIAGGFKAFGKRAGFDAIDALMAAGEPQ